MDHAQTINVQWPAQDCLRDSSDAGQPYAATYLKQNSSDSFQDSDACLASAPLRTAQLSRRYSFSSSSGSDTSDQSEVFSQASDSTAATETDFQSTDYGSIFQSPTGGDRPSATAGYEIASARDFQTIDHSARATVETKLAALDRSGEQRIAASRQRQRFTFEAGNTPSSLRSAALTNARPQPTPRSSSYAPNVPVGRHRCALSSIDSVLQTRSQRFPVQRCNSALPPHGSKDKANVANNPRRTGLSNPLSVLTGSSLGVNVANVQSCPVAASARRNASSQSWSPPSLVREEDRRKVMVEQLVETASQLISAIWPGSVSVPEATQGIVISLPFFVRETLRRSRTSYNSLQVALYYIVKLRAKGQVAACGPGNEKSREGHGLRAMRCGRRMLLTSLILASKYLQDRNFSARAWSKISGLPVDEITSNEMAVLNVLDWKLHVTESDFAHWSTVVHKSTEVLKETGDCKPLWQQVIKLHREGASIEALAMAMRPAQQMQAPSLRTFPEMSLPSPTSSVDSFRGLDDAQGQAFVVSPQNCTPATAVGFTQGMLATPASSPIRGLSVRTLGLPPSAPRLDANLTTPSFTPVSLSQASTPAVLPGARQTGASTKTAGSNLGWTEFWMPSPVSLSYSSDEDSEKSSAAAATAAAAATGTKRRADSTANDEIMAGASPPKVSRRC